MRGGVRERMGKMAQAKASSSSLPSGVLPRVLRGCPGGASTFPSGLLTYSPLISFHLFTPTSSSPFSALFLTRDTSLFLYRPYLSSSIHRSKLKINPTACLKYQILTYSALSPLCPFNFSINFRILFHSILYSQLNMFKREYISLLPHLLPILSQSTSVQSTNSKSAALFLTTNLTVTISCKNCSLWCRKLVIQ